jgi:hypothetical protein
VNLNVGHDLCALLRKIMLTWIICHMRYVNYSFKQVYDIV